MAGCLRRLTPDEIPIAIVFLTGETHQGKLGLAYAELHYGASDTPAPQPSLTLKEVDAAFAELATSGKGASAVRAERLAALFSRATTDERDFLARLIVGELRQGALKGLMLEAVSAAAEIPVAEVRRAAMSAGGIAEVARAALAEGVRGLARFSIRLMQPVLPMLAQSADSVDEALERLGTAAFEWKLDGARAAPRNALILDGEAIALKPDGSPRSFQVTMRRFGRKLEVEAMRRELPLSVFFFDCLLRDDEALADRPPEERIHALKVSLPATAIIPRIVTADGAEAARFFDDALRHGHE
ncbi:MAG: ATP-dependent DNA ligase, partial [Pyrinomonadaceae bacterium]|nr:ATP-dependent DNA ligase [Pyrinomonadaceae bacterium]